MPNEVMTTPKPAFDWGKQLEALTAKVEAMSQPIALRPTPIAITTWDELERFAEKAANSGMVPKEYVGKPDAIIIAVQMGLELGLTPMQSLINIAVINGRPSVWGDALPGLVRSSGMCAYIKEWSTGEGDNLTYHCETRRKDDPNPIRSSFSVADAKRAGLWQTQEFVRRKGRDGNWYDAANDSPWFRYQARMLKMRPRGFCLRDAFPDVLKGLISAEEAGDMVDNFQGLTIPGQAVQVDEPRPPTGSAATTEQGGQQETKTGGEATNGQAPATEQEKPKRKPSIDEWLSQLNLELALAQTVPQVEAILSRENVINAQKMLRNGALIKLNQICQAALEKAHKAERARAAAQDQNAPQTDEIAKDLAEAEKNFTTQGQPEDEPKGEDKPKTYERRPTTPQEWISALDAQLAIATPDEVRLILQREDVLKAQENMTGQDRVKLFEVTEAAAIRAGIEPEWADEEGDAPEEDAVAKAAEDAIKRAEEEKAAALKAADDTWPGPR